MYFNIPFSIFFPLQGSKCSIRPCNIVPSNFVYAAMALSGIKNVIMANPFSLRVYLSTGSLNSVTGPTTKIE